MDSLGRSARRLVAVVAALVAVGLLSHAARTIVVVVSLARLLVLAPLLALGLVLVALPVSVGIAAAVERLLSQPHSGRQREASKARGRLSFTTEAAWSVVQLRSLWEAAEPSGTSAPKPALHPSTPDSLQAPVDAVFTLVMRDFVRAWFDRLSPSAAFPTELESTIRESLGALIERAIRVDLADVLVSRIVPLVTAHLDGFARAETTLSGSRRQSTLLGGTGPASEGLDVFLVQAFGPSGGLHKAISGQAVDARPAQEAHLRELVRGILARILPERNRSPIIDIIAREVVTCSVLMPIVELLSDPDFWNRLLDEQATKHIREQKLIHQLRAALETTASTNLASSASSPSPGTTASLGVSTRRNLQPRRRAASVASSRRGISSRTEPKAFDAFIKGIGRLEGVLDARRMRSDVEREIRRTKELLEVSAAGGLIPTGETPTDLRAHLERLVFARTRVDHRLGQLAGPLSVDAQHSYKLSALSTGPTSSSRATTSLLAILTEPSSLSFFMEYMERRSAVLPVQFWLMVESFRMPLEDFDLDAAAEDDDRLEDAEPADSERVRTAKEDLGTIWETYFDEDVLGGGIAERFGPPIEAFLRGRGRKGMLAARRSMFGAQRQVYETLEEDYFPAFRSSDLYFKAAANVPAAIGLPAVAVSAVPRTAAPQPPAFPHRATTTGVVSGGGGPVVPRARLRKAGSASSSLELTGGRPAPSLGSPLQPSLSLGTTSPSAERAGGLFDGDLSQYQVDRRPSPGLASSSPFAVSPPVRSPRILANSHFDFLITSDDGEDAADRPPLFVDPDDDGPLDDDDFIQIQRMEAIQAALTDIIAKDESTTPPPPGPPTASRRKSMPRPSSTGRRLPSEASSMARSLDSLLDPASTVGESAAAAVAASSNAAPRMDASLPDLATARRPSKRVFDDDSDDEDAVEVVSPSFLGSLVDAQIDSSTTDVRDLTSIGILQLPGEIARVTARIGELGDQEALLDALIRKAELAGNKRELALLTNSHRSLVREVRGLLFQKRQWEQQEFDSRLSPGRTAVSIPSATNVPADDGKPVTRYLIEVQQLGEDGAFAHGWVVARRYNEFFSLHHDLREKLPSVRHLVLPGKMLVTSMSSSFVDSRRVGLERYLQALITVPEACSSLELRAFMSQISSSPESATPPGQAAWTGPSLPRPQDLVKSLYRTVTSGLDDLGSVTAGPDSIFDLLSQGLTKQAGDLAALAGLAADSRSDPSGTSTSASASGTDLPGLADLMGLKSMGGETASSYFTAPICDLFVEVFQLKENNWLRRQAIVIILQQILGGTIERKLRDVVDRLTGPESFVGYLAAFTNTLWPGGLRRPPPVLRTEDEKRKTKEAVAKKLPSIIPDIASNMIGRGNTRRGAKRLFAVLQHTKLNQSLVHSIIDELVFALFPEIRPPA